jgi:glycogen(starch) synthase
MSLILERRPKHILMTADTLGGVWVYALELSRVLKKYGVKISLATMGRPLTDEQWAQVEELDNVEIFESSYKLEWMDSPWRDVYRSGEWLLDLEERLQPDLVHVNGYCHASISWSAPKFIVGHSCVFSWWQAVKGSPPPGIWNRYRLEVSLGLNYADCIVCPSQAMLDALHANYNFDTPAFVIHNGRDPQYFNRAQKEKFVIAAGRLWDQAKNVAAVHASARDIQWPVYVAGDEICFQNRAAVNDRVRSLGFLPNRELAGWFARAPIYVAPALYEPFGLSILEAAMSGCALVLGDIPSLREIWRDAAFFVPPRDADALAGAISILIENPDLMNYFSARAHHRAQTFTAEKMARAYMRIYEGLLNAGCCISAETA